MMLSSRQSLARVHLMNAYCECQPTWAVSLYSQPATVHIAIYY